MTCSKHSTEKWANLPAPQTITPLLDLQYLHHAAIDRERWDATVAADQSRLPYGFSWWLDSVTDGRWEGIVADDYRLVFPLPVKRQFGPFRQIHRAPFTQQGGPYGPLQPDGLQLLLAAIPHTVFSGGLPLLSRYASHTLPTNFSRQLRPNLILDLTPEYAELLGGFSKTLRKKLRRYGAGELQPSTIEEVIDVYRTSSGKKAGLTPAHYRQMERLMKESLTRKYGNLYRLEDNGTLLAAGFFPISGGRVINLFAGSTQAGFSQDGMSRLLAAVIERHRAPGHLFDFEGSGIPGVAAFFKSFGAKASPYPMITRKGLLG